MQLASAGTAEAMALELSEKSGLLRAASELRATAPEDPRDSHIRHFLRRGAEYARGCASLGRENNAAALAILGRTSLEHLILMLWVVVSEANALELQSSTLASLTRAARVNLFTGNLKVRDRATGENVTAGVLSDKQFSDIPRSKTVEARAQEAGVIDLYNIFYRFMSLEPHGHELLDESDPVSWERTAMHLQAAGAFAMAAGHVGTLWLLHRKRVDNETLRELLGL